MSSNTILEEAQRRSRRSWSADGIQEIGLGLLFLLLGALAALAQFLPPKPALIPMAAVVIFTAVLLKRAVWRAKRWLAFPRSGYARPKSPSRRAVFRIGLAVGLSTGVVSGLVASGRGWDRTLWLSLLVGATMGGLYALIASSGGWRGIGALACGTLAAAVAWGFLGFTVSGWAATGLLVLGAVSAASGAGALWSFLKHHPVAEQEPE